MSPIMAVVDWKESSARSLLSRQQQGSSTWRKDQIQRHCRQRQVPSPVVDCSLIAKPPAIAEVAIASGSLPTTIPEAMITNCAHDMFPYYRFIIKVVALALGITLAPMGQAIGFNGVWAKNRQVCDETVSCGVTRAGVRLLCYPYEALWAKSLLSCKLAVLTR